MRFASLNNGQPDGRLHLISRDHQWAVPAKGVLTLQSLLELWTQVAPALQSQYDALNGGDTQGAFEFDPRDALAALPRAWQWLDGSAFVSHGQLMEMAFGLSAVHPEGKPLMYQGISDRFLGPLEPVPLRFDADDIDFEGEFGVICDAIPQGADPSACREHIRLLVLINDWSLRRLGPLEMKTGFGVLQCKPRCSMAPVAVTPDELGDRWRDARIDLTLNVTLNDVPFGRARGGEMSVGFDELASHAAYSRDLVAGTVIGSGTVSNQAWAEVGSSCISERRMIEKIQQGQPSTPFMKFDDKVRMEALDDQGRAVFGVIEQRVSCLD